MRWVPAVPPSRWFPPPPPPAALMLCWLCCWPDSSDDASSEEKQQRKSSVIAKVSWSRRRSTELMGGRRGGSTNSAVSLHLPTPSGSLSVSSHRSHEEIPRGAVCSPRAPSAPAPSPAPRYHSAPSVIHEVLHRRDWDRSSKDLYIPLRPPGVQDHREDDSDSASSGDESPNPAPAPFRPLGVGEPSVHCPNACKKHHTNIKSSQHRTIKEATRQDIKDTDATEHEHTTAFFIGEAKDLTIEKSVYKAKHVKQTLNESIKKQENTEPADYDGTYECPPPPPASRSGTVTSQLPGTVTSHRDRHASDGDILMMTSLVTQRPESGAFSESDLEIDLVLQCESPPPYHAPTGTGARETAI